MRLDCLPLQPVHKEFTHNRAQWGTYRHTYVIRKLINLVLLLADVGFQTHSQELEELSDNVRISYDLIE